MRGRQITDKRVCMYVKLSRWPMNRLDKDMREDMNACALLNKMKGYLGKCTESHPSTSSRLYKIRLYGDVYFNFLLIINIVLFVLHIFYLLLYCTVLYFNERFSSGDY